MLVKLPQLHLMQTMNEQVIFNTSNILHENKIMENQNRESEIAPVYKSEFFLYIYILYIIRCIH